MLVVPVGIVAESSAFYTGLTAILGSPLAWPLLAATSKGGSAPKGSSGASPGGAMPGRVGRALRIAIYARYSDDMQSRHSCDDQIRECREYNDRNSLGEVVLVEKDEAVRAYAVEARRGYARLMAAAERGEFDVLLVFEIARFSRDFLDGMAMLREITKFGVKLADTKMGLVDLDTPQGQMMISVNLMQAHQEVRRIGENSKRGLKGKVERGFSSGGKPAYGMRRVAEFSETERDVDGRPKRTGVRIEPDPDTAHIVKRIFREFTEGCSKREIARRLNEARLPSRDAGSTHGGRKNIGMWATASVKKILENEVYAGFRIWNKHSRKGKTRIAKGKKSMVKNHESEWMRTEQYCTPIIEMEVWERTQELLKASKANFKYAGRDRQYLCSGLLKCAVCDGSFVIGSVLKGVRQYACSMRTTRGDMACTNSSRVPQEALERKVRRILDAVAKDPLELMTLVKEHNDAIDDHNRSASDEANRLEGQLREAQKAVDNLVSLLESGGSKAMMARLQQREKEVEDLTAALERTRAQVQPRIEPHIQIDEFKQGRRSIFTGEFRHDKQLVTQAIKAIVVGRDGTLELQFHPESMFRLARWSGHRDGLSVPESSQIPLDQARFLAETAALASPKANHLVEGSREFDAEGGSVDPRNHSQKNCSVPSGIYQLFSRVSSLVVGKLHHAE